MVHRSVWLGVHPVGGRMLYAAYCGWRPLRPAARTADCPLPIGAVFGAAALGHVTDRLGRKAVYFVDLLFFVTFAALSALAWNVQALIVFRFLLGVGIGADYPIGATYVSELMPARARGRMIVGAFSFQALGALAGAVVGLLVLLFVPEASA